MNRNNTFVHTPPNNRTSAMLFRLVCILLSIALMICGCTANTPVPVTTNSSVPATTNSSVPAETTISSVPAETTTDATPQDPFLLLQKWLDNDVSFTLSYKYMNLAVNGMSQTTTQTFAADGSWSFITQSKAWNYPANYEAEDNAEFYYRYEDSQLVCYNMINGDGPQRGVLNETDRKAMDDSKAYLIGIPGLLPDYLQDLSVTQTADAAIFTYMLPVEKVLADRTFLALYVQNVCTMANYEYDPALQLLIGCCFEADPETFQPKSLSFDFSQLKPYVLPSGALSGEYALGTDFVTMEYTFDYNLPPTITIPENMIP